MISFICCSIRPEMAIALEENIRETIGDTPFEFIAHDNRAHSMGICEVYNRCAERARYDNLCFLHEDIKFLTTNWSEVLLRKLLEEDCGIIGFAGCIVKMDYPSGWYINRKFKRVNYLQSDYGGEHRSSHNRRNPEGVDYSEVVTVDGMAMFVRRELWCANPFDEQTFKGFHCYDVDFALAQHTAGYKNYVANLIYIEHFSRGSFSEQWRLETLRFHEKWSEKLPLYASTVSKNYIERNRQRMLHASFRTILKYNLYTGVPASEIRKQVAMRPMSISSLKLYRIYRKYRSKYR